MKQITGIQGLSDYGFNILTGEACNLGLRLLVDLDKRALKIYCRAYGLRAFEGNEFDNSQSFSPPWNRKGVVSVMMNHRDYGTLAIFALLENCHTVWECSGSGRYEETSYFGFEEGEELRDSGKYKVELNEDETNWTSHTNSWESDWKMTLSESEDIQGTKWPDIYGVPQRRYSFGGPPNNGEGRNIHAFTGRTE